jgi:predicted nucleic acid-binding protein
MEIALKPRHMRRPDVAEDYEVLLANDPTLVIAALDRPTARRAAELRAEYRLRPADAWHVGACLEQGATALLSNDRELRRITDLHVWMLEDFV